MHKGVIYALLATALFGASTPFSKILVGQVAPVTLAGLLYLGSGLGLLIWFTLRAMAAGILLSWDQRPVFGVPWGALAIVAACLCWAIDNNLTRKVSASGAVQIAGIKGLVAGSAKITKMPLD